MNNPLVLTLNCGSSSIKCVVVDASSGEEPLIGIVEKIGSADVRFHWTWRGEEQRRTLPDGTNYTDALSAIMALINEIEGLKGRLVAVGHRVVHGGEHFTASVLIDETVLETVRACSELAPLHNPANIKGIEATQAAFPDLPQMAVFDTAFHQTMPDYAYLYALPYDLYTQHRIRRYGFHGTSHRFVTQEAARRLGRPVAETALLSAHLGNGCSAAAVLDGRSVDTTMGMTPLEGLVMGTRSGDIDPGLHAYLTEVLNTNIEGVTRMLNKESGLLGISGLSMDMRTLMKASAGTEPVESDGPPEKQKRAQLAIEIFCYRLAKQLAALSVPLGRIDALIFTGGIGENNALVREKVLRWLGHFGFKLDKARNAVHGADSHGIITQAAKDDHGGPVALVIETNEALMIAQDCMALL